MKALRIIARALLVVLLLLLAVILVLTVAKVTLYKEYIEKKETVCTIPDIHGGYVPQGLDYAGKSNYIFSGYHGDDLLSLYMVKKGGEAREFLPVDANGRAIESHGGGVTSAGDFVYVTGDSELLIFSLSEMEGAADGSQLQPLATFPVDTQASFCFADEEHLYVGEFYRAGSYETDQSHAYTTPSGEEHRALISCYPLAEDGSLDDAYPLYSISVIGNVQGFAVKNNTIILSTSWGLSTSKLYFYNGMSDSGETIGVSGKQVPLYYLDSTTLEKTMELPAFSEDLDIVENRVIVSFESACNKYIVGKLFFADKVISLPIPLFADN